MRIAVDARELSGKPTGVGRYLAGLLREWTRPGAPHTHEFLLYSHRSIENSAGCSVREVRGTGGTLWEQRALPAVLRADNVDVLFSPAYSTPVFTDIPRVVALHDISFVAHPEWFAWREGLRRRTLARRSAAVSRRVITISQFSKSEIISRLGVDPSKIAVIPPGIDSPVAAGTGEAKHLHLPDGEHLLYVGSIFNRRHIPGLIAAFTQVALRHEGAWLHLVGDNRSHPFEDVTGLIEASPMARRIEWHQYAPDEAVRELYRQARGFVFLSEYEGLGLTPLEALAAGIPSLLLDTAVARESCGDAASYVPLGPASQIADAIERLLYDAETRRALANAAPATLARYDWARAARETLAVLEDAAR